MKALKEFLMEEELPDWAKRAGEPVSWDYRGSKGYGHIVSVEKLGKTNADTMYKVRPSDRAFHPGEPEFRVHAGSDIHTSTDDAIKAHLDSLRSKNESVLNDVESKFNVKMKGGRVVIAGFPVDVDAENSTENSLEMDAVDPDAAGGLVKALRAKGIPAKRVGPKGILVGSEGMDEAVTQQGTNKLVLRQGQAAVIDFDRGTLGIYVTEGSNRVQFEASEAADIQAFQKFCGQRH